MGNTTKVRLAILGKKQIDLLFEIRKRGYKNLEPPTLSTYINGNSTSPQAQAVLELIDTILTEWESEVK